MMIDEERIILYEAMETAYKAYSEVLDKYDLDGAYFNLYLTGYVLNTDFTKAYEIRLNPNNTGYEDFQYGEKSRITLDGA